MNGSKFPTGRILRAPVEVVKGRILAGWAQKSPEPCFSTYGAKASDRRGEEAAAEAERGQDSESLKFSLAARSPKPTRGSRPEFGKFFKP